MKKLKNDCLICENGKKHKCFICDTAISNTYYHDDGCIICDNCTDPFSCEGDRLFVAHIPENGRVIAKLANFILQCKSKIEWGHKLTKKQQILFLHIMGMFHVSRGNGFNYETHDSAFFSNAEYIFETCIYDIYDKIDYELIVKFESTRCKLYAIEWGN